ncbi:MAG: hypothetical protein COV45_07990 [Deltaproteobacteria bacterium CG11_big_fil_rev_8_21_14_0_20_47_16]|nr:MAG: hypothetical protein COV45_07990 [Deltaproteobacteria bacterium CG11_big_fil_rev_8_21_14_0_20_47_16]
MAPVPPRHTAGKATVWLYFWKILKRVKAAYHHIPYMSNFLVSGPQLQEKWGHESHIPGCPTPAVQGCYHYFSIAYKN